MGFLFDKFFSILNRSTNIVSSQVVLAANLLEGHPTGQAAEYADHWNARTANYRFAMLDFGVEDNAIIHGVY